MQMIFQESKLGGTAEPSLVEIHQEMSELLDKQVKTHKEKNFRDSRKLLQAHEKVCNEMKQRKKEKNDAYVKMLLKEGIPL